MGAAPVSAEVSPAAPVLGNVTRGSPCKRARPAEFRLKCLQQVGPFGQVAAEVSCLKTDGRVVFEHGVARGAVHSTGLHSILSEGERPARHGPKSVELPATGS